MPHSAELHSQVRALAHRLASGQISWADYREQRAVAVAAIVGGMLPLDYRPPELFGDPTTPKEHELSQNYIDIEALEREPRRWPAIVAVGVFAVVLAGAAWLMWRLSEPPVVASAPVVVMSPAEGTLDRFLDGRDWSAQALDDTLAAWQTFTVEERADARRTATWRQLRNAIREQINQQQVLATVDETGEAEAQEARLLEFQRGLNL